MSDYCDGCNALGNDVDLLRKQVSALVHSHGVRAVLQFNLPECREDFDAALNGGKALSLIHEVDSLARNTLKYASPSDETRQVLEQIRTLIFEEGFGT